MSKSQRASYCGYNYEHGPIFNPAVVAEGSDTFLQLYSVGSRKHFQWLDEMFVAMSAELVISECCIPSFKLN